MFTGRAHVARTAGGRTHSTVFVHVGRAATPTVGHPPMVLQVALTWREPSAAARDLLASGGVRVDGEVVDRSFIYVLGATHVCQAGKKAFARITLKSE